MQIKATLSLTAPVGYQGEKKKQSTWTHQWFLTWLSVLPGNSLAISDQRLPSFDLASDMILSSSTLHGFFLIIGSVVTRDFGARGQQNKNEQLVSVAADTHLVRVSQIPLPRQVPRDPSN